jgi:hypothetical protein
MKLLITNTDEVTVWLLFISTMMLLGGLIVLLYACILMIDVRHRLKASRRPERERNDKDWPTFNGRQ